MVRTTFEALPGQHGKPQAGDQKMRRYPTDSGISQQPVWDERPKLKSSINGAAAAAIAAGRSPTAAYYVKDSARSPAVQTVMPPEVTENGDPHYEWLPNPHFEAIHLSQAATVLKHTRQAAAGSADAALGALVMDSKSGGVHRFLFTIARSKSANCTGLRVGIASADGSRVCAIRPWDGQLYPTSGDSFMGDPRCAPPP